MIRSAAILLLILSAAVAGIPDRPQSRTISQHTFADNRVGLGNDPNATTAAFNYTYSQANLYSNSSRPAPIRSPAINVTGTSFAWLNTVTNTTSGANLKNTGFEFNITKSGIPVGKQVVNWTLTAPSFNCKGCTSESVNFDFFGSITKGTNASYALYLSPNATIPVPSVALCCQTFSTLGSFPSSTGNCPEDFCITVPSNYIGYNMTLSFTFRWNSTESQGMFADVGEIVVASLGNIIQSTSNYMQQDPSNSSQIIHTTDLTKVAYNNTLTTKLKPANTNSTRLWWSIEVINIYYPAGYRINKVYLNSTLMFNSPPKVPFERDSCVAGTNCSESLFAFNLTDFTPRGFAYNSTITIISITPNSLSPLATLAGGTPTQVFAPGDTIGVNATNRPAFVNGSITQKTSGLNITFLDHNGISHVLQGQTFPTQTILGGVFNVTLPPDCSLCGTWTIVANFASNYDMGTRSYTFRMDQLQVKTFSSTGSNARLNAQGTIGYASSSTVAVGATGIVFAVDTGTSANLPLPPTTNSSNGTGLFVANATLVNGVFTQGQSLMMIFTIVNPSSQAFNASSIRIEHEWPGSPPQTHGVFANFTIGAPNDGLGDLPFNSGPQVYKTTITLTPNGVQIVLTYLSTRSLTASTGNSVTSVMSRGTSPVNPTEQHAGLFKITVATKTGSSAIGTPDSLQSPPYAYVYGASVLGIALAPSRYLAYSSVFTTDTNGGFSVQIASNATLGAKKLVLFALCRDATGVVVENTANGPGFSDSTILQASMDSIAQVAEGQSVTATLHLTSNSTSITAIVTVNLNLQGSTAPLASASSVSIPPGGSVPVALTFKTPSTAGQYSLTFSSPQYQNSAPLAGQTLQVVVIQNNLQILIPAAIGIVVAIVVLGAFLIRKSPEKTDEEITKIKPSGPKKPTGTGNPPAKSLTRTEGIDR